MENLDNNLLKKIGAICLEPSAQGQVRGGQKKERAWGRGKEFGSRGGETSGSSCMNEWGSKNLTEKDEGNVAQHSLTLALGSGGGPSGRKKRKNKKKKKKKRKEEKKKNTKTKKKTVRKKKDSSRGRGRGHSQGKETERRGRFGSTERKRSPLLLSNHYYEKGRRSAWKKSRKKKMQGKRE